VSTPAASLTDAQLIDLTRTGDVASAAELHRRHAYDAKRVARVVADDHAQADSIVAEAFARVNAALRAGDGPEHAFVPYLRTVIRRLAVDAHRRTSDEALAEEPVANPAAVEDLPTIDDEIDGVDDRHLVRDAYETLPDRWQRALWFTEIEGRAKEALIPDLGSSTNAVAALAYRAREGLRQAYLAVHLSTSVPEGCADYIPKLPAYIREALTPEEDVAMAMHLDACTLCRSRRYELLVLVSNLRSVLAPALLGYVTNETTAVGALDPRGVMAGAGLVPVAAESGRRRLRPRTGLQVATTTIVSAAAAAVVAYAAVSAIAPSAADESGRQQAITAEIAPTDANPGVAVPPPVTLSPFDDEPADEDDAEEVAPPSAPPPISETVARGATTPAAEQPAADEPADEPADDGRSNRQSRSPEPSNQRSDGDSSTPPGQRAPADEAPADDEAPEPPADAAPDPAPEDPEDGRPRPLCAVIPGLPWC
jgi:RNA polymerase sigma factor (sigma-70 family)